MVRTSFVVPVVAIALSAPNVMRVATAAEPVYQSPAVVNAKATMHSLPNKYGSAPLDSGVVSRDVVKLTPPSSTNLSEARVTLNHLNYSQVTSKVTEYTTWANSVGKYLNTSSEVYTSERQGNGFQWIPIKIGPGSQGTRRGTPVRVTVRLVYSSRIERDGRNQVQVYIADPRWTMRLRAETSVTRSGTGTASATFNATAGETFYLAVCARSSSSKPNTSAPSALASSETKITVQTDALR